MPNSKAIKNGKKILECDAMLKPSVLRNKLLQKLSENTTKHLCLPVYPRAVENKSLESRGAPKYSSTLAQLRYVCTSWCTKASASTRLGMQHAHSSLNWFVQRSHLRVVDAAGDGLGPRAVVAAGRSRGGQTLANHEARVARHLDVVARLVVELEGRNAAVLRVAGVRAPWLA
jgi:hypothetical protein